MSVFLKPHKKITKHLNKARRKQMAFNEKVGISDVLRKTGGNTLLGPEANIMGTAQKYWDEGREQRFWDQVYNTDPASSAGVDLVMSPGRVERKSNQAYEIQQAQAAEEAAFNAMMANAAANAYVPNYQQGAGAGYTQMPVTQTPVMQNQSPDMQTSNVIQQQSPGMLPAEQAQQATEMIAKLSDPVEADRLATMLAMQMAPFDEKMFV